MLIRFILWWLASWVALTGGLSLAFRLFVGSFDPGTLPIIAIPAALLAVMIAAVAQCDLGNQVPD